MTNIGLFHSHFCAPTLLFIILVSVTQEGHCFLSWHLLMCISFAMVSHTQTVQWIQWELSWPEAARISLCHYLNELCCVGFFFCNITIHSAIHNMFLCSNTYQNKYQKSYTLYSLFLSKHFLTKNRITIGLQRLHFRMI